tara:strand:- start:6478 stop:6669 length:192 start_codon:yes stop_codon:yes gene_type:complete
MSHKDFCRLQREDNRTVLDLMKSYLTDEEWTALSDKVYDRLHKGQIEVLEKQLEELKSRGVLL